MRLRPRLSSYLAECYGAEGSKQTITTITDSVLEGMAGLAILEGHDATGPCIWPSRSPGVRCYAAVAPGQAIDDVYHVAREVGGGLSGLCAPQDGDALAGHHDRHSVP